MRMIIFVVIVVAGLVVMIGRPNITINFNYGEKQRNKGPQRATGGHKGPQGQVPWPTHKNPNLHSNRNLYFE